VRSELPWLVWSSCLEALEGIATDLGAEEDPLAHLSREKDVTLFRQTLVFHRVGIPSLRFKVAGQLVIILEVESQVTRLVVLTAVGITNREQMVRSMGTTGSTIMVGMALVALRVTEEVDMLMNMDLWDLQALLRFYMAR
jgi:hypothetical protein